MVLSPFLVRIVSGLLLLFSVYYIGRRLEIPQIKIFRLIPVLLLARDIGVIFYPNTVLFVVSDFTILMLYVFWIRTYSERQKTDGLILAVGIALSIVGTVLKNLEMELISNLMYFGVLAVGAVYYATIYLQISYHNTSNPHFLLKERSLLLPLIIIPPFIFLLFGFENWVIATILQPLSYAVHLYLVLQYFEYALSTQEQNKSNLQTEINNVFAFMKKISSVMADKLDIKEVLTYIVESAVENTKADGGAVFMIDEYDNVLKLNSTAGFYPPPFEVPGQVKTRPSAFESYMQSLEIKIGETLLGESVQSADAIFIQNSSKDERLKDNTNEDILFISSYISIPLIAQNKVLGILSIVKRKKGEFFSESDFNHIQTFADYASLTIDNLYTYIELLEKREMEREVGIAAEIQNKLIPQDMPQLDGISLSVQSTPLHGVSGDYYDVFPIGDNKVVLFMCDVAGKGIPAALIMVMIHSILHLIANPKRDVASTLNWINRGLFGRVEIDHYATMSCLMYDTSTKTLEYTNAAHHPLLIIKPATRKVIRVDTSGLPIGIEQDSKYEKKLLTLDEGDIALLYTDGITEAMNSAGEQYGLERLLKILHENAEKEISDIENSVKADIAEFVGRAKQHDDQTLLIMKVTA